MIQEGFKELLKFDIQNLNGMLLTENSVLVGQGISILNHLRGQ